MIKYFLDIIVMIVAENTGLVNDNSLSRKPQSDNSPTRRRRPLHDLSIDPMSFVNFCASVRQLSHILDGHYHQFGRLQHMHGLGVGDVQEALPVHIQDLVSYL